VFGGDRNASPPTKVDEDAGMSAANETEMPAEPKLPDSAYADAMKTHVELTKRRVRGLYVRPRALFAEAVVAALVGGDVVEFPAAAWDVEVPVAGYGREVRVQVKCSGERAPYHAPGIKLAATWGKLAEPKFAKDPNFRPLGPGFHCDVFVFARHEGTNIRRGWWFYVLPMSVVRDAVRTGTTFTSTRLEQLGATRCEPSDLRQHIIAATRLSRRRSRR
jgi:hypothetical protein